MVYVIASVTVKAGRMEEFIEVFKRHVPAVRAEKGCIQYVPTIDFVTDAPAQVIEKNVVTNLEIWENMAALQGHVEGPAMAALEKDSGEFMEAFSVKVLREA